MKTTYCIFFLFLISCAKPGYFQQNSDALDQITSGNYGKAYSHYEGSKYLKEPFNETLRGMELGRLLFLQGKYEEAAKNLIAAELNVEDWKTYFYRDISGVKTYTLDNRYTKDGSAVPPSPFQGGSYSEYNQNVRGGYGEMKTGAFISPHKTQFSCMDYERPLINFYVGLCGIYLKDDKPFVEAKRLNMMMDNLSQRKFPLNASKATYSENPFIHLCAGFFYEAMKEPNNALISYEKALKAYEHPACMANYGISLPNQLIKDIYRLNLQMGFKDKADQFLKKYDRQINKDLIGKSSVLLLVEDGQTPVRRLEVVWYQNGQGPYLTKKSSGNVLKTSMIDIMRLPYFEPQASIKEQSKYLEGSLICDIDYQMMVNLRQRMGQEFGTQVTEALQRAKNTTSTKTDVVSYNIKNYDSRNWQTLPAHIYYYRIPLSKDEVEIKLKYKALNGGPKEKVIKVKPQAGTQLQHVYLN